MALSAQTYNHLRSAMCNSAAADEVRDILEATQLLSGTEAGYLDEVTAGTFAASKAMVLNSSGNGSMPDGGIFKLGADGDIAVLLRATTLNANTALTGAIVGTPVTPAVAANSLIIANVTADGDILLAGQTGGNTSACFFHDASAQTTSIMVTGVAVARFDSTDVLLPDDYILTMGTGCSIAYKSTSTNANTAVTSVVLGTPVTPAVAADTLFISNQIADGDLILATQTGGNTQAAMFVDASAGSTNLLGAGVQVAAVTSTALTVAATKTLAVTTADLLTVGGVIVPQAETLVSYVIDLHASKVIYNLFVARDAWQVTHIDYTPDIAQGGALTATVVKATGTNTPASATTPMHSAGGINLDGTAHTVQVLSLTGTTADLQLAVGNRIAIVLSGAMTVGSGLVTIRGKRI